MSNSNNAYENYNNYNTRILLPTESNIDDCAELLKQGELVGMPTETVYGLACNALDENAISKIFRAKGRPQDNPLIVHVANFEQVTPLVKNMPKIAKKLADKFWGGPLTIIFDKSKLVPYMVTAGLDSIAVRIPAHKVALDLIEKSGLPIAAPSANTSGKPSPTTAIHVLDDFNKKIPAILDGGECEYGIESTVITIVDEENITLLRPGAVTVEMLREVVPSVEIDVGVLEEINAQDVISPGMKYLHYAPKTNVVVIDSDFDKFVAFITKQTDKSVGALVFEGEEKHVPVPSVSYGNEDDQLLQAKMLFKSLRAVDSLNVKTIYARMPQKNGLGLAIYNRLIKAAGFEIIKLK